MLPIQHLSIFKKIDWSLFAAVILLAIFGLAAIYSVALGQSSGSTSGLEEFLNFKKQLMVILANYPFFKQVYNLKKTAFRRVLVLSF